MNARAPIGRAPSRGWSGSPRIRRCGVPSQGCGRETTAGAEGSAAQPRRRDDRARAPRLAPPDRTGGIVVVAGVGIAVGLHAREVGTASPTACSRSCRDSNLTDMEKTCYKIVRADLMKTLPLRADRFGIEPELTGRLAQAGVRIYEVPVRYSDVPTPRARRSAGRTASPRCCTSCARICCRPAHRGFQSTSDRSWVQQTRLRRMRRQPPESAARTGP